MQYVPLNKLFYSDNKNYEKIYNERFNSEYAVHVDFRIGEHDAFFVQTPEIYAKLLAIQKLDKQVERLSFMLPGAALEQFEVRCLIDEIVLTNNIEGVHSTRREIGTLIDGAEPKDKSSRFYGLVQKYLMLGQNKELEVRTCADIRAIYDELLLSEIKADDPDNLPDGAIFRKGSVSVSSASQKELHRGVYPESKIIAAMEKALAFLNDDGVELLYRAAAFHYFVGYIHPFYDGNGRLNRFISSYLLGRELSPLLSYRLSYTVEQSVSAYYNAFSVCNDPKSRGDITPFVTMFLGIVETSVEQLKNALEKRDAQLGYYLDNRFVLPDASDTRMAELYSYLIQAALFSESGISKDELTRLLKISRNTLQKLLSVAESAGLLCVNTKKRLKRYELKLDKLDELIENNRD